MKFFQMKEDGKKQLNKMKKNKHSTSCCCTLKVQEGEQPSSHR